MKKQTAVEWLIDEIRNHIQEHGRLDAITISELKMKAKEIERGQILRANLDGLINDKRLNDLDPNKTAAKMLNYYDKTYS